MEEKRERRDTAMLLENNKTMAICSGWNGNKHDPNAIMLHQSKPVGFALIGKCTICGTRLISFIVDG